MTNHSHDARHRVPHNLANEPRRFMAGLALPTAAAVTLMFTATGAAVATSSPSTQSVASSQTATAVLAGPSAAVEPAVLRASRLKAVQHARGLARAEVAAKAALSARVAAGVARSQARKKVAARAVQVEQARAAEVRHAWALQVRHARALKVSRAAQAEQAIRDEAAKVSRAAQASRAARTQQASRAAQTQQASPAPQANGWQLPISNPVTTSGFGYRWGRLHAGQDFGVSTGTPLAAMSSGTVVFAGQESGYGTIVKIRYSDGTVSYYGHMSSISVSAGQSVSGGQNVGQSGNTGHSTGPHLHLEIHPNGGAAVDPAPWLANHNIAL